MTLEVEVYLSQLNNGTFVGHFGRKMIRSKLEMAIGCTVNCRVLEFMAIIN